MRAYTPSWTWEEAGDDYTFDLLQSPFHGTTAASTGHCDDEFVMVFGHIAEVRVSAEVACWIDERESGGML